MVSRRLEPMATSTRAERWAKGIKKAYAREVKRLNRTAVGRRPWFVRDQGARLNQDRALLSKSEFSELMLDVRGREVVLTGFLPIVSGSSGITHRIAAEVRFSDAYPLEEPAAYDIATRFKAISGKTLADRHLGINGWCCLWLQSRSEWKPDDPDSLVYFIRQLAAFFERQLICDVVKRWPGPEYAHGYAGYVQDIRETLGEARIVACYERLLRGTAKPRRREECPCGRGESYVLCHKSVFAQLSGRMPQQVLDEIRCGEITLCE